MSLSRRSFLAATSAATLAGIARSETPKVPKFQLGLVTYNVVQSWDLPAILKVCQANGFAAVECRTTHKHGVEPKLTADERKTVKQQFADAGVKFWGSGSICEFHSADKSVVAKNVEDCKKFVQLVADLGGKGVKVRPNGVAKGMSVEAACNQIGDALKLCGNAAADAGVEIWVEVHGAMTAIPKNMKAIMDSCGHKSVGVTWNSNPTDIVDGSIAEGFELLKSHIKSCHINDLTNDKAGKYPYRDLFQRLQGIGYDRYTLCEVGKSYDVETGTQFLKEYRAMWSELVKG